MKPGAMAFIVGFFLGRWIASPLLHMLYWVLAIAAFACGYTYGN